MGSSSLGLERSRLALLCIAKGFARDCCVICLERLAFLENRSNVPCMPRNGSKEFCQCVASLLCRKPHEVDLSERRAFDRSATTWGPGSEAFTLSKFSEVTWSSRGFTLRQISLYRKKRCLYSLLKAVLLVKDGTSQADLRVHVGWVVSEERLRKETCLTVKSEFT